MPWPARVTPARFGLSPIKAPHGLSMPLLYAFADDTHLPDNEIIHLIFFQQSCGNMSVPSDMCRIFPNPSLPIRFVHPELCSTSNGKALLRRLPCFARPSKRSNITEVLLLQFSEPSDKGRFCFTQREAAVIARNVRCGSFVLVPPFLGCSRLTARQRLKSVLLWMDSCKSRLGCLCEGRNLSAPCTHPGSPRHRPWRHLLLALHPCISLRVMHTHSLLSHEGLCFFLSLPR